MESIDNFDKVIKRITGVYLDSSAGFRMITDQIEKVQGDTLQVLKISHPELANIGYLDSQRIILGEGNPNTSQAIELHHSNQKQYNEKSPLISVA